MSDRLGQPTAWVTRRRGPACSVARGPTRLDDRRTRPTSGAMPPPSSAGPHHWAAPAVRECSSHQRSLRTPKGRRHPKWMRRRMTVPSHRCPPTRWEDQKRCGETFVDGSMRGPESQPRRSPRQTRRMNHGTTRRDPAVNLGARPTPCPTKPFDSTPFHRETTAIDYVGEPEVTAARRYSWSSKLVPRPTRRGSLV